MDLFGIIGLVIGVINLILLVVVMGKLNKPLDIEIPDNSEEFKELHRELEGVRDSLNRMAGAIDNMQRNIAITLKDSRDSQARSLRESRDETNKSLRESRDEMSKISITQTRVLQQMQKDMSDSLNNMQTNVTKTLTEIMSRLQQSNEKKLDEIRGVVNEKLDKTLNERLDSNFKLVGDSLSKLHESLGQLQNLSSGVESLNKTLTNVKTRGTWGEVQLGRILEQTLTDGQYQENVATKKNSSDKVEYAIPLPGDKDGEVIYLPIDSKFPSDIYNRIVEASENADADALRASHSELKARVLGEAAKIRDKYLDPPRTTSYAIMFLPTEGLYAEVLKINGLTEECQLKGVMVAGPTTITALLNTISVGFRNYALNKKSAEVRKILEAVKTQIDKLDETITNTQKKLSDAVKATDKASDRTRIMKNKMKNIGSLEASEADAVLGITDSSDRLVFDEDDE
ncbi:MAG: DNA recombination protein RmuC [Saccharofermentans sp.]|nr:DNA recombination protein RmuC [Saccharofermentans sp.]